MKKTLAELFANSGPLDQRSANMIINTLEKNNLPGFDYLEYKQSLEGLSKMNMDEATAFQSAFVTASTLGLTKEKLKDCLLYTSPSPRDLSTSRMPSSA